MKRFYITTAIDYPNNTPHLGTAYEKVTADVIARYKRMAGIPVHFLMGNDEHSTKVAKRAEEQGLTPIQWCDRMEAAFKERWAALDVSFDDFIRTSQPRHKAGVLELLKRVREKNPADIFEGAYEGWFCHGCEGFKTEKDLVDGKCPLHPDRKPEWLKEKNWTFKLSRFKEPLLAHFAAHPEFLEPETRRNEIVSFLKNEPLQDLSISRRGQSWGIEFPGDPSSVVYVWFDALTNYISAIGFGSDEKRFSEWWAPAADVLHVIGKDITRFHCVYWPAMLMSAGVPLPQKVFGHGWVSFKGERMSKSLGNIVEPLDVVQRHGPDPLRLYLVREIPYGGDGDFTWERFEERYNADLANNYGNLVSRITTLAAKNRGGTLARPAGAEASPLAPLSGTAVEKYRGAMDRLALHDGAGAAFELINQVNEHLQREAPWTLVKDPSKAEAFDRVMWESAEALRIATILLHPVMPRVTVKVLERLGRPGTPTLDAVAWGAGDFKTTSGDPLFPRIEDPAKQKPAK